MRNFVTAVILFLSIVSAIGQPRTFQSWSTLTNLVSSDPRSYSGGGTGVLVVLGRYAPGDEGPPKVWTYNAASTAATNQWCVKPASGVGRIITLQTNAFLPLTSGAGYPLTGRLRVNSPYATNQFIDFWYAGYEANNPIGISAGLYGTGEHYLRIGSINTNTWNMLNSWLTVDGDSGTIGLNGPVRLGGETRTNWPVAGTNLPASSIVSGVFDLARIPSSVALDAEIASLYGGLGIDNLWTGTQTFDGDVLFAGLLSVQAFHATNSSSVTLTNTGRAVIGGDVVMSNGLYVSGTSTSKVFHSTAPWSSTYEFTEFYNQNGVTLSANSGFPWGGSSLAGGVLASSDIVSTNHPGISRPVSSASPNSGYAFGHRPTALYMDENSRTDFIFRPLMSDTNTVIQAGWLNSFSVGGATQGGCLTAQNGWITLRTFTGSTTPNIHSVSNAYSTNVWYRAELLIGPETSRSLTLTVVESDTGNLVFTTSMTSNIPSRTTAVGHGMHAFQYTGGTANIVDLDFLGRSVPTKRF